MESFSTARLTIRRMEMGDEAALFALKSDADVTRLYGEAPHASVEETRRWVQECIDAFQSRSAMVWSLVLRSTVSVIGMACLWNLRQEHRCAEVGFELDPRFWRQGLMSEALETILEYGFSNLGLNRIEATPLAINQASRSLLLKFGFREEGVLRQRVLHEGRYLDEMYLALLHEEWASRRTP